MVKQKISYLCSNMKTKKLKTSNLIKLTEKLWDNYISERFRWWSHQLAPGCVFGKMAMEKSYKQMEEHFEQDFFDMLLGETIIYDQNGERISIK